MSAAAFTSRDEKWVGVGREEDTTEERWEGEREHRFRLKVTGKGVGGTRVAKCNVHVMKKCQVTFIYIALLTIQIVSKQLHTISKLCVNNVKLQDEILNFQMKALVETAL